MNAGYQLEIDPSTGEESRPAFAPKVRYNYLLNSGSLIEIDPLTGKEFFPSLQKVSGPVFLLIQGRDVLDYNISPVCLAWSLADKQADIIVACGITNEYREKEITCIVAKYIYIPFARSWLVTVDDSIPEEVDVDGKPGNLLRDKLYKLKTLGKLSDPLNMSKVTIQGIR
jgi:hypothetical protein